MIIVAVAFCCWKNSKYEEKIAFDEIVVKFKQENNLQLPQQVQRTYQGFR